MIRKLVMQSGITSMHCSSLLVAIWITGFHSSQSSESKTTIYSNLKISYACSLEVELVKFLDLFPVVQFNLKVYPFELDSFGG